MEGSGRPSNVGLPGDLPLNRIKYTSYDFWADAEYSTYKWRKAKTRIVLDRPQSDDFCFGRWGILRRLL